MFLQPLLRFDPFLEFFDAMLSRNATLQALNDIESLLSSLDGVPDVHTFLMTPFISTGALSPDPAAVTVKAAAHSVVTRR